MKRMNQVQTQKGKLNVFMAFLSLSLSRSVPPRQNEREEKNEALWFDWLTCSFACVSVKAASKRKVTDERVEEKEKNNIRRMISSLGNRWVFDSSFCWWPTCPRTQGDTSPELRAFFKQKKTCAPWIHDESPFFFYNGASDSSGSPPW